MVLEHCFYFGMTTTSQTHVLGAIINPPINSVERNRLFSFYRQNVTQTSKWSMRRNIFAGKTSEKVSSVIYAKQRLKSACAYPSCQTETQISLRASELSNQSSYGSDSANAQADLNLRWAYIFVGTFSDVAAPYL